MTNSQAREALLSEYETMQNVGIGALSLWGFCGEFQKVSDAARGPTLWHLATVLPLVLNERSRRAIAKRRVTSGLRAIIPRDADNDIAQGEAVFNLNSRMRALQPRTLRSLNCAIGWGLLTLEDGCVVSARSMRSIKSLGDESRAILGCAQKIGTWAGALPTLEYLTILGVEVAG